MPGTPTPNYAWPIPADNDGADGPGGFHGLGFAADATVKTIDTRVGNNETAITGLSARLKFVTSTTRPAPTAGAMIFETDTNRMLMGITVASVSYWVPMPGALVFSVYQNVAQSLPDGAYTALTFQVVQYDPFGFWVPGSPTQFKPKFPGWFELTGAMSSQSNATNYRGSYWYKNGGALSAGGSNQTGTVGTGTANVARPIAVQMNGTTDYIELMAMNTSGAALNTSAATVRFEPNMTARYLGQ